MNNKPSRALVIAVTLNVILAAALLFVWWRSRQVSAPAKHDTSQMTAGSASAMSSPADGTSDPSHSGAAASTDPALAPIQLSPQRLQSIGVRLGTARIDRKSVV